MSHSYLELIPQISDNNQLRIADTGEIEGVEEEHEVLVFKVMGRNLLHSLSNYGGRFKKRRIFSNIDERGTSRSRVGHSAVRVGLKATIHQLPARMVAGNKYTLQRVVKPITSVEGNYSVSCDDALSVYQ